MLPAWATVLVALGASALGGVVGSYFTTVARIRHERDEQQKVRLLEAADDFLKPPGAGRIALFGVQRHLRAGRGGVDQWVNKAGEEIDAAAASVPRVALLFGEGSTPAISASVAISLARGLLEELRADPPDLRAVGDESRRLRDAQSVFNRAAGEAIERPSLARSTEPGTEPERLDEALAYLGIP